MRRDGFSNFKYYQALAPQDVVIDGSTVEGVDVDTKTYDTVTFVINVGANTSAADFSADEYIQLKLEHAHDDGAGAGSTWSEVYPSEMIHSVHGEDGAYSTLASGAFQSIDSVAGYASQTYFVGYKGSRRHARIKISGVGQPSVYSMGAIVVLGEPSHWPVNEPV